LSTGMAHDEDIEAALNITDRSKTILLHCVSAYPAPLENARLSRIPQLRERHKAAATGLSDHSTGAAAGVMATALGAALIEKHIAVAGAEDDVFALSQSEFKDFAAEINTAWAALHDSTPNQAEASSRQMRRSIYAVADIKHGEPFTPENVAVIRPSYGLHPRFLPDILNKTATADIQRGMAISWELAGLL